jgi:hypothetical protein
MENSNTMNNLSNNDQNGQDNNMNNNPYISDQDSSLTLNSTPSLSSAADNNPSPYGSSVYSTSSSTDSSQNSMYSNNTNSSTPQSSEVPSSAPYSSPSNTLSIDATLSPSPSNNSFSNIDLSSNHSSTTFNAQGTLTSFPINTSGNENMSENINPSTPMPTESNTLLDTVPEATLSYKKNKTEASKHSVDLKSETKQIDAGKDIAVIGKVSIDVVPLALALACLAFFLLLQNFAQACKKYCQTDSSLSNSIISGSSLAYLLSKGFPFMMQLVNTAKPSIENLYLSHEGHLLLVSIMAFGLGFLFNYSFEKKTARNIIEDVPHSSALYRINLMILAAVFFFSGLLLINVVHMNYIDVAEYGLFMGLLLCMETSTLSHIFSGRNDWLRRITLSTAVISGFAVGKQMGITIIPLLFSMGFSFMLGFFVFTTMRVELATVKRNSCYPAFIISFVGIMALTLIQSLYESVRC